MASNSDVSGVMEILFPASGNFFDQERTDAALAGQRQSAEEARGYMGQSLSQLEGLNQPLIQMGNEQLAALRSGIESGAFSMDESMFGGYRPYTAQIYQAPGQFQYNENRPEYTAPGAYQYDSSRDPAMPGAYSNPALQGARSVDANFQTGAYQDPGFSLQADPGFQRRVDEANRAIEASAAARGMQLSGANLKDLQANASNMAADETAAAYNRYAQNRSFGAGQNTEQFSREQIAKNLGMDLNNQDLNRWSTVSNTLFPQYSDQRNFAANQGNINRNYGTSENQRAIDNALNAYNINNSNFGTDRSFNYGANQDYNANQFNAFQYNTGNQQQQSANAYQQLIDAYTRQAGQQANRYGMIGDLVNIGTGATQNMSQGYSDYFNSLADIGMQEANAAASAAQAKNSTTDGFLSALGL